MQKSSTDTQNQKTMYCTKVIKEVSRVVVILEGGLLTGCTNSLLVCRERSHTHKTQKRRT